MAKKTEKIEETTEETKVEFHPVYKRLNFDFGREDLNEMQNAINELFQR